MIKRQMTELWTNTFHPLIANVVIQTMTSNLFSRNNLGQRTCWSRLTKQIEV
jgi:hypothetical protein